MAKPEFHKKEIDFIKEFDESWISDKITTTCITFSENFGKYLVDKGLTTSQIRNIFGEIKRIQLKGFENQKTDFLLLKPKIEYAAKRANKPATYKFKDILKLAIDAVDADNENAAKRYENFCDFVEAVLAYHKAFGGRDN
jgi:CRISPR-associated protein Csm2